MNIKKTAKNFGITMVMAISVLASMMFLTPASTASAAPCTDQSNILTFPNWYRGVYTNAGTECNIEFKNGINDVWVIVTNLVEILIQAVGYVAVGFIIFGGIKYITSQGEAAGVTSAKQTITRAVVGLVISIVSVLILNLVVGVFGLRTQGPNSEIQSGSSSERRSSGGSFDEEPTTNDRRSSGGGF